MQDLTKPWLWDDLPSGWSQHPVEQRGRRSGRTNQRKEATMPRTEELFQNAVKDALRIQLERELRRFADAVAIKQGKLHAAQNYISASAKGRSAQYQRAIATWQQVIDRLATVRTKRQAMKLIAA